MPKKRYVITIEEERPRKRVRDCTMYWRVLHLPAHLQQEADRITEQEANVGMKFLRSDCTYLYKKTRGERAVGSAKAESLPEGLLRLCRAGFVVEYDGSLYGTDQGVMLNLVSVVGY